MKKIIACLGVLLLCSCTSSTLQQSKYYVLNAAPAEINTHQTTDTLPVIKIDAIHIADYLQKANIVLQISNNELYFSTSNLWAEPLNVGIAKTLSGAYDNATILTTNYASVSLAVSLDITIDYFHIIDKQAVVLAGSYVIKANPREALIEPVQFTLRKPLHNSGYPYAVSVMSSLVKTLGQHISTSVAENIHHER